MRVARLLIRLLVAAAAALLVTVVFDPAAGLASTQPGFSTEPTVVEHPPVGSPTLVGLRAGRHANFDRVVFQLDGPIPSYYSVRYVPVVRLDGSGEPLQLRGGPGGRGPGPDPRRGLPAGPDPDSAAARLPGPARGQRPGLLRGQTTAGIGVTRKVGFRVFELTGPTRIVIDLAHPRRSTTAARSPPRG